MQMVLVRKLILFASCIFFVSNITAQVITTYAGNGQSGYTGDGGLAINAAIGYSGLLTFDRFGCIYISELNNTVRKVSKTGIITTVAGNGTTGFSGDNGLAVNAQFDFTGGGGMTCDTQGNLYIADQANNRIRKISASTGIVTTIAGIGSAGFSGDGGLAINAQLNSPFSVCLDANGNLYIVDGFNFRIRKIDIVGNISTIAGNGTLGVTGDGGLAVNAQVTCAGNINIDNSNNLLLSEGVIVRKINLSTGVITTIAGNGSGGYSGDGGPAINAQMATVLDAWSDIWGDVYISDKGNNRVRKVTTNGIIQTVVGTGSSGYNGDNIPAISAQLYSPRGIALDSCGNLYISDNGNRRIRKVTFHPDCFPTNVNTLTPIPFSIYPNPAFSQLTITGNNLKQINITNTLGQNLLQQKVAQERTVVDISFLSPGIYFITATDANGSKLTKKIVKE